MATANLHPRLRRKLALVIGNNAYSDPVNRLMDSVSNAEELSKLLETIGFDVIKRVNAESKDMLDGFKELRKKLKRDDMIFVYFSGHIYPINSSNYLIPVNDSQLASDPDVEDFALNIGRNVTRLIEDGSPYAAIFVLDFCGPYSLKRPRTSICEREEAI
jgi:uncharacterized caspase-like protein